MIDIRKDPDARKDYQLDWGTSYLQDGETLSSSTWEIVSPPDAILTIGTGSYSATNTTTTATVWLVGGTLGKTYYVTNHITTSAGRIDDETLRVFVAQK